MRVLSLLLPAKTPQYIVCLGTLMFLRRITLKIGRLTACLHPVTSMVLKNVDSSEDFQGPCNSKWHGTRNTSLKLELLHMEVFHKSNRFIHCKKLPRVYIVRSGPAKTVITVKGFNFPTTSLRCNFGQDFWSVPQYVSSSQANCPIPMGERQYLHIGHLTAVMLMFQVFLILNLNGVSLSAMDLRLAMQYSSHSLTVRMLNDWLIIEAPVVLSYSGNLQGSTIGGTILSFYNNGPG